MGYHPESLAFSFPPYPKGGALFSADKPYPWTFGRWLYNQSPWLGFDIWHIDPERRSEGQRTDDSCGWFDRRPQEYANAVAYLLADMETVHEIERSLLRRTAVTGVYGHTYPRLGLADTLALVLMVATELELRRWWNGQDGDGGAHASLLRRTFTSKRNIAEVAHSLALNPLDNLSSADSAEGLIGMIASALHRHFKPWWRHPRWHVHHWKINFHLARNVRRMFERCGTCEKPLGFGCCPVSTGSGMHHASCLGIEFGATRASTDAIKENQA